MRQYIGLQYYEKKLMLKAEESKIKALQTRSDAI